MTIAQNKLFNLWRLCTIFSFVLDVSNTVHWYKYKMNKTIVDIQQCSTVTKYRNIKMNEKNVNSYWWQIVAQLLDITEIFPAF